MRLSRVCLASQRSQTYSISRLLLTLSLEELLFLQLNNQQVKQFLTVIYLAIHDMQIVINLLFFNFFNLWKKKSMQLKTATASSAVS